MGWGADNRLHCNKTLIFTCSLLMYSLHTLQIEYCLWCPLVFENWSRCSPSLSLFCVRVPRSRTLRDNNILSETKHRCLHKTSTREVSSTRKKFKRKTRKCRVHGYQSDFFATSPHEADPPLVEEGVLFRFSSPSKRDVLRKTPFLKNLTGCFWHKPFCSSLAKLFSHTHWRKGWIW